MSNLCLDYQADEQKTAQNILSSAIASPPMRGADKHGRSSLAEVIERGDRIKFCVNPDLRSFIKSLPPNFEMYSLDTENNKNTYNFSTGIDIIENPYNPEERFLEGTVRKKDFWLDKQPLYSDSGEVTVETSKGKHIIIVRKPLQKEHDIHSVKELSKKN